MLDLRSGIYDQMHILDVSIPITDSNALAAATHSREWRIKGVPYTACSAHTEWLDTTTRANHWQDEFNLE